jgi:hypothetical protein
VLATATVTLPPRRNLVLLLAGLVAALLVYALLSSAAVVGALEEVVSGENGAPVGITATFDEPSHRELSELRTLLTRTPAAARELGAPISPTTTTTEKPAGPGPGARTTVFFRRSRLRRHRPRSFPRSSSRRSKYRRLPSWKLQVPPLPDLPKLPELP